MKQPVPVTLDTDNLSVLQIGAGLEYQRDAAYDQYFPTTIIMFGEQIRGWMKAIRSRLSKIAWSHGRCVYCANASLRGPGPLASDWLETEDFQAT